MLSDGLLAVMFVPFLFPGMLVSGEEREETEQGELTDRESSDIDVEWNL